MLRYLIFLNVLSLSLCAGSKDQVIQVQRGLDRILSEVLPKTHVGVEVISLTTGLKLYEKNVGRLFIPASALKLFTTAAALDILGLDFCFETQIRTDGTIDGARINGNLYLVGSGDPEFSVSDLEMLVRGLRLRGIQEVTGDLLVDCSAFDEIPKGPGWMWDDVNSISFSSVSALTINHSCVSLWVRPAVKETEAARLFVYPKTRQMQLINETQTIGQSCALQLERPGMVEKPTVLIKGSIPLHSDVQMYSIPVDAPNLYAGEVLGRRLKQAGITIKGKMRVGQVSQMSHLIVSHRSRPLSMLIQTLMKHSDNLYADHLFKKMGQQVAGVSGTWANGGHAVRTFLEKEINLDAAGFVMLDGSGLSRYNLTSPNQIAQLLTWVAQRSPYAPEFIAALPIAGGEGTLKNRLQDLEAHLRAKTGRMQGIRSLCGYLTTKSGEKLVLVILANGFVESQSESYKKIEDQICLFLRNL